MNNIIQFIQTIYYPLLFFSGLAIRLIIGMRRFRRRGWGGLQHFNNYFVGLITFFIEWLLKWIALGMMLWGFFGWIFE